MTRVTTAPAGIYAVAVVFFFTGLIVSALGLGRLFAVMGWGPIGLANAAWTLPAALAAFFLVLGGVHLLVRMRRLPQWLLFAMTILLAWEFAAAPAGAAPGRLYLNRVLWLLPLLAACAYLLTPRVRAATRW